MKPKSLAMIAVLLMASAVAAAQGVAPEDQSETGALVRVDHQDAYPAPTLSRDDGWVRKLVAVVLLGLFLPAAIIGPWVRRRSVEELPELHDQEEQSGLTASQHEPGHSNM
jgi:hypothetical protein